MLRRLTVTLMVLTRYSAFCTEGPDPDPDPVPPDPAFNPIPPDLVIGTRADDPPPAAVPPDLVVGTRADDPPPAVPPDLVVGTRADDAVPAEPAGCGCHSLKRGSAVDPAGGRTPSSVEPGVKYSRVMNEMPSKPRDDDDQDTASQVAYAIMLLLINRMTKREMVPYCIASTLSVRLIRPPLTVTDVSAILLQRVHCNGLCGLTWSS